MITPKIKRLEIEWKHFAIGDATCERCGNTGEALREAVGELRHEFSPAGVKINLTETLLDKTRIAESNEIRMNGMLIEDLLAASVASTSCPSCSTLAGESTCCRAIEIDHDQYEDIPVWAIKKAAYLALGVQEDRSIRIEWQHVGEDIANTCERCSATGSGLRQVLRDLEPVLTRNNIRVDFKETILPPAQIRDSNRILINGKAFENYLSGSRIVETPCCSCSCVEGADSVTCRAIDTPDGLYESIPVDLLRRVLLDVAEHGSHSSSHPENRCGK
jgi:hypothetical protein